MAERFVSQEVVRKRLAAVEPQVQAACERSGRSRDEVKIVAVTKYIDVRAIGEVLAAGLEHIGENRVQDALPKYEAFGEKGTWHFIGHLQTNKVREVVGKFDLIHSLDRLSLAKEINKRAKDLGIVADCLLQINVSGEETKFGLDPNDVLAFVEETSNMEHIRIIGLMTMAPFEENAEDVRHVFRGLREWRDRLQALQIANLVPRELSMGMSNDFEVAIEEGATYIRLGSILVSPEA